jgi:hypothetical protein
MDHPWEEFMKNTRGYCNELVKDTEKEKTIRKKLEELIMDGMPYEEKITGCLLATYKSCVSKLVDKILPLLKEKDIQTIIDNLKYGDLSKIGETVYKLNGPYRSPYSAEGISNVLDSFVKYLEYKGIKTQKDTEEQKECPICHAGFNTHETWCETLKKEKTMEELPGKIEMMKAIEFIKDTIITCDVHICKFNDGDSNCSFKQITIILNSNMKAVCTKFERI